MAAYYLRADTSSICDCLSAFGLNDLLFDLSRYDISRSAPVLLSRVPRPSTRIARLCASDH